MLGLGLTNLTIPKVFFFGEMMNPSLYYFFRQLRLLLRVKLMEINSNLFSKFI